MSKRDHTRRRTDCPNSDETFTCACGACDEQVRLREEEEKNVEQN